MIKPCQIKVLQGAMVAFSNLKQLNVELVVQGPAHSLTVDGGRRKRLRNHKRPRGPARRATLSKGLFG